VLGGTSGSSKIKYPRFFIMGLKKYILRKGLGSPGQTARVWANHYNRSLGSNMTEEEALEVFFVFNTVSIMKFYQCINLIKVEGERK